MVYIQLVMVKWWDCACRALQLHMEGQLPVSSDGRLSAGPVDVAAFLAQPHIKEAVKQALHRCLAADDHDFRL